MSEVYEATSEFSGANEDRKIFIFPVQLTARKTAQPYPFDLYYSCYMGDETYIHGST